MSVTTPTCRTCPLGKYGEPVVAQLVDPQIQERHRCRLVPVGSWPFLQGIGKLNKGLRGDKGIKCFLRRRPARALSYPLACGYVHICVLPPYHSEGDQASEHKNYVMLAISIVLALCHVHGYDGSTCRR